MYNLMKCVYLIKKNREKEPREDYRSRFIFDV